MIDLRKDIDSLTHFKRETAKCLDQLRKTGRPIVLTVNGKAELVVQDVAGYQKLLDVIERIETIEAVQQALDETDAGQGRPAAEAFARLRKKHSIPRDV